MPRPSGNSRFFIMTPDKVKKAQELRDEGISLTLIASRFGVSPQVISNALRVAKLKAEKTG